MKIQNVKIFYLFPVSLFALQRRRSHKSGRLGIQLRGSCASYQGQSFVPPSALFIRQVHDRLNDTDNFCLAATELTDI